MNSIKRIIVKYGLWHKKEKTLLRFISHSPFSDDSIELNTYDNNEWLVDDSYNAAYVRMFSTPWYNAGHRTPMHGYEPEELEVVRVVVKIDNEEQTVSIPEPREFFIEKYQDSDPEHLKGILKTLDSGLDIKYSLYDLEQLIEDRKKGHKKRYDLAFLLDTS